MRRKNGFTLVELLVVIAIIAMLVGLLVPAIQRARETARRANCINNQGQVGKAIIQFATAKDRLPYLTSLLVTSTGPNTSNSLGWLVPLLPYLEKNELYQLMVTQGITNTSWTTGVTVVICPSDSTKINNSTVPNPLSYVVNSGRWDATANTSYPFDWKENGIFFDQFQTMQHNLSTPASPWPQTQIDMGYISKHDGTSTTVLLGENRDATQWQIPGGSAPNQDLVSLIWEDQISPPVVPGLNQAVGTIPAGSGTATNNAARPSSDHPGGYLLSFCDGHVQFISNDVQYQVYALLMTPNGAQSRAPMSVTYVTTSPTQYSGGIPVVVTPTMIDP